MSIDAAVIASRQRGAGLIEVMISLLVLSIGTLGLGGLQITAKRTGFEATQRSEATALAMDLFERMRANREALPDYAVAGIGSATGASLPVPAVNCASGPCSAIELKQWDLWNWEQALDGVTSGNSEGGLVLPMACITVAGREVTLVIAWRGFRAVGEQAADVRCGLGRYGQDDADRVWLRMTSWIGAQ